MNLPMICACTIDTKPLMLMAKLDDLLTPIVEIEATTLTCHQLELMQLPLNGKMKVAYENGTGVLFYGTEMQSVALAKFAQEMYDRLSTWCQLANVALGQPELTAAS